MRISHVNIIITNSKAYGIRRFNAAFKNMIIIIIILIIITIFVLKLSALG